MGPTKTNTVVVDAGSIIDDEATTGTSTNELTATSTSFTSSNDDNINNNSSNDGVIHRTTTTPSTTTTGTTITTGSTTTTTTSMMHINTAFGLVGLLNNCPYVIMLANAKYISEGGVASVYIANIIPGLLVQLSAPYWFDIISYQVRLRIASIAMAMAFLIVSYFSYHTNTKNDVMVLFGQLFGVAMISFQCGLGEASLLALAGKWDSRRPTATRGNNNNSNNNNNNNNNIETSQGSGNCCCLSSFAMGTGIAGPIGFLWKIAGNEWFKFSVSASLFIAALLLSLSYGYICHQLLVLWSCSRGDGDLDGTTTTYTNNHNNNGRNDRGYAVVCTEPETGSNDFNTSGTAFIDDDDVLHVYHPSPVSTNDEFVTDSDGLIHDNIDTGTAVRSQRQRRCSTRILADMSVWDRFQLLLHMCWPYMIPLFVVYTAEYACQAGAWTTIGFPTVTSAESRIQFFERSNWLYQAGVFISRSTGSLLTINIVGLWIMPAIQMLNLIIFSVTASTGVQVPRGMLYEQSTLLSLSFFTGLLGGAVYVHGYNRIVRDVPKQYTEFAVASTSVAVSFGVLVADVIGLYLQSCLYQRNGLDGAVVQCPL